MKRLAFLISLLCLAIFLLEGSAWAHGSSKHKLRPSADIRNSGEITAKIDFCGAAGANGAEVDIVGHSFSAISGPTGKVNLQYIPKGCYTLRVRIKDQPEHTEPVCVKRRFITDMGTISLCSDNDGDGFTPDVDPQAVNGNDCNDNNPTINPDALELCDGIDNDCDGSTDGDGCTACTDADSDGFFAQDGCGTPVDCDDTNNTVRPFAEEICDGADNNCEGTTDEGFDFDSDPDHCGGCGIVCAGTCTAGVCSDGDGDGIEPPEDCDDTNPNVFPGAVEICDGIDNNCDGVIDEGNPGGNVACTTNLPGECASGITACQLGAIVCESTHPPTDEICDGLDNNCDGTTDEGNVCAPVCGNGAVDAGEACDDGGESATCNDDCTAAVCGDGKINATANEACDDGGESATCNANCTVSACGDGQINGTAGETCDDGNTDDGDGCSATCQSEAADGDGDGFTIAQGDCNDGNAAINPGAADEPDDAFVDSNCDGIDGDESRAIFVATSGLNTNPGTKAAPVNTITQALTLAGGGKDHVYISEGNYIGGVNLVNGVSMWGSYSASNNWTRSLAFQTNIVGTQVIPSIAAIGVRGVNITSATTVADLQIRTSNVSATGVTNYGIHCSNCDGLTLSGIQVIAGNGGSGINGRSSNSPGAPGGDGSSGTNGNDDDDNVNAIGGAGGAGCTAGGSGGRGGRGSENGLGGENGSGSSSGGFGGSGGFSGDPGGPGQNGTDGFKGTDGADGGASGDSDGSVVSGFWKGFDGGDGSDGFDGRSGGGGGGGGGQNGGIFVIDGTGNGGGGGGAGGCGGNRGFGGTAGGGSFGLFLVNSTGVNLSGFISIRSGDGGRGGNGGSSSNGGIGGDGGLGATMDTDEVGAGGNGGDGGNGGRGGHGAGGAGGVSFAIGLFNSNVNSPGTLSLLFGGGGSGGSSSGNNGRRGDSGSTRAF